MKYSGVVEISAKWGISERSVRNYCSSGKVPGIVLDGKTWKIPSDAVKPARKKEKEKYLQRSFQGLKLRKSLALQVEYTIKYNIHVD